MSSKATIDQVFDQYIVEENHAASDYFAAIKQLLTLRRQIDDAGAIQAAIDAIYRLIGDEIATNNNPPNTPVKFGTSGWRGILGKDLNLLSVAKVTAAILSLYREAESNSELQQTLGVSDFATMQKKGCVVGFDNRFGGPQLAQAACNVLAANGVTIYYAGEATTGILSASVLIQKAAFSINLTPSHNPMEYGGFKFNAADAGPAAPILTNRITELSLQLIGGGESDVLPSGLDLTRSLEQLPNIIYENALRSWQSLVRNNSKLHGIDYDKVLADYARHDTMVIAVDCVHGASRKYLHDLCANPPSEKLLLLRAEADFTFGGIAPEPSSTNMQSVMELLQSRSEQYTIGAIIDPDGDRIRLTDGTTEISMNQFGAMAYHFLHEHKKKKGLVAKTVASSNLANALARQLNEEVFEPKVGFKEFKPVIGTALVFFEESDGISIIGHTTEKDAFIGLILAMDMVLTTGLNLGEYLREIEEQYGYYYPDRDGIEVDQKGKELQESLARLERYGVGTAVTVGGNEKTISELITIDGRKMIFEDGSWLMIRPSGTEPKVRFYVEARSKKETVDLVATAKSMLAEIGVLS
jgi:phosphomannomutase